MDVYSLEGNLSDFLHLVAKWKAFRLIDSVGRSLAVSAENMSFGFQMKTTSVILSTTKRLTSGEKKTIEKHTT